MLLPAAKHVLMTEAQLAPPPPPSDPDEAAPVPGPFLELAMSVLQYLSSTFNAELEADLTLGTKVVDVFGGVAVCVSSHCRSAGSSRESVYQSRR